MKTSQHGSLTVVVLSVAACSSAPVSSPPAEPAATGEYSLQESEADYVPFPGGKRIHKSCVHHMEAGAGIRANGDIVAGGPNGRTVEHVPPCQHKPLASGGHAPIANGNIEWQSAAPVNLPLSWVNGIVVGFNVPQGPSRIAINQEEVFLWSGLTSSGNGNTVLQPVLSYGITPNGCGGPTWTDYQMVNYYIDPSGNAFCGAQTPVNPGTRVWSEAYVDTSQPCDNGGVNCSWVVEYTVDNGANWIGNEAYDVPALYDTAITGSLEAYHISDCGNFPGGHLMGFADAVYVPGPQWNNFKAVGASNLTLTNHKPPPVPPGIPSNCGYNVQTSPIGVALSY
jgi:hypothetical protein